MSDSDRDNSSSGRRAHNCAKCFNHGIKIPRRNHKENCEFKDCPCNKCRIVSGLPPIEHSRDPVAQHRDEQEVVEPRFDGYDEEHVPELNGLQLNSPRRSEKRRRDFLVEWEQAEAKRGRGSVERHLNNTGSTITPEDVQQLIDIFPEEDICMLQCIYEGCDGDNDVFVQLILKNLRSRKPHLFEPPPPPSLPTPSSVVIANPGIWNNPSNDSHINPYFYPSFSPQPVQPVTPFPTPPDFSHFTPYSRGTSTITRPSFLSENGQQRNET